MNDANQLLAQIENLYLDDNISSEDRHQKYTALMLMFPESAVGYERSPIHSIYGYKALTFQELIVILGYFNSSANYQKNTDELLKNPQHLTTDMRRFIADIMTGRVNPKKTGRKSNHERDSVIYERVTVYLSQGLKLTSGKKDGAAAKVAEELGESEDVIIKAYNKFKKQKNEEERINRIEREKIKNEFCDMYNIDSKKREELLNLGNN